MTYDDWKADVTNCEGSAPCDEAFSDPEPSEPDEEPYGTCDWGNCDSMATAWRFSPSHGWLPVCDDCLTRPDPDQR